MKDFYFVFLAIIGTVIGSGFISGKEVAVFFSRFGIWSFPAIIFTFFLLFFLLRFLLFKGQRGVEVLSKSKFAFLLNFLLCTIFSSSMIAGTIDMAKGYGKWFLIIFVIILLFFSAKVCKSGIKSLNKLNFVLVPIMAIILLFGLGELFKSGVDIQFQSSGFGGLSFVYSILYVVLNTANGCMLISSISGKLSAKQKTRVAFWSALVLCLILLLINIVLLSCPRVLNEEMPLLALFSGGFRQVLSVAILIGCLTTLFSLVYSCSSSMRGLCKNEYWIFFASVVLPFGLSLLGFGFILSYLYPLGSIIGIFLLGKLAFIPLFKRADKEVHSASKDAK